MINYTSIQNITPTLMEWGKIKIGRKGKWVKDKFQAPEKLKHFIITTMERGEDNNFILDDELMTKLMNDQGVDELKSIPVSFLYNDPFLNFQSVYQCYSGMTRWCYGNGSEAQRLNKDSEYTTVSCPCERCMLEYENDKGRCKATGRLNCLIAGAEKIGGVWMCRTAGFNSVRNIQSSLLLTHRMSGGILAGLPFMLTVSPKSVIIPKTKKPTIAHVLNLHFEGTPIELRKQALQIAQFEAENKIKIETIETETRKLLVQEQQTTTENQDEYVEEFFPEEVVENANEVQETDIPETKKRKGKDLAKNEPEPVKEQTPKIEAPEDNKFDLF